ncbi:alpha/beta hydrolase fold domain-containing protein [Streptomyces specialis]|uniref:alpha/beta hydrolase fold domain-containing protein n=1 Tax=Streptomyces specialis TaxID=498367 RepID=UPI00073F418A|nr:alpha/beta hydrolase [Streptomyces specialis]
MISAEQTTFIQTLRLLAMKDRLSDAERTLTGARRLQAEGPARPPARVGRRVDLSCDDAPGFPVWTFRPKRPADPAHPGRAVLYVHGGGYIMDFAPQHWEFLADLTERTGSVVRAPQYPLAPGHTWRDTFPPLLDMARGTGGPPPVLMGDSAGGGLVLALAQTLAAEGGHAPETVLISPFVDATLTDPETAAHDETDPWLAAEGLRACGRAWAGADDPARPEISPLFGDFTGLGRMLVFTGTRDTLHPQNRDLARRARAAGVACDLVVALGSIHVYPLLAVPEARGPREAIAAFLAGAPATA